MVGYCSTKNCITNGILPIIVHTFPLNACTESLVRTFIVILKLLKYFITTQGRVLDRISVHAFHAIYSMHQSCTPLTGLLSRLHVQPHLSVNQTYYEFHSLYRITV